MSLHATTTITKTERARRRRGNWASRRVNEKLKEKEKREERADEERRGGASFLLRWAGGRSSRDGKAVGAIGSADVFSTAAPGRLRPAGGDCSDSTALGASRVRVWRCGNYD